MSIIILFMIYFISCLYSGSIVSYDVVNIATQLHYRRYRSVCTNSITSKYIWNNSNGNMQCYQNYILELVQLCNSILNGCNDCPNLIYSSLKRSGFGDMLYSIVFTVAASIAGNYNVYCMCIL